MDTQTIDILAIIGATFGLIGVTVYSFRKIGGINKIKFEHFKRATSLHQPPRPKPNPPELAESH